MTSRFRRPALLAASALVAAGAMSACAPIETNLPYDPSDGTRVELAGSFRGDNLMIVSGAEGEAGQLLGGLSDLSGDGADLTLTLPDGTTLDPVRVPAQGTIYLDPKGTTDQYADVVVADMPVPPGATMKLTITSGAGSTTADVPVLNGDIDPYGEYLPR